MELDRPDWVDLCEYLEVPPPNPNYSHKDEVINKIKEIQSYFVEKYKDNHKDAFVEYIAQLSASPKNGQSRLDQVLRSVKLQKLAGKLLRESMDA